MRPSASGRLTVGLNLLWLVPGDVGGTEDYAVAFVRELAAARGDVDLVAFCQPSLVDVYPELADWASVSVTPRGGRGRGLRLFYENTWLPQQLRNQRRVDVVHHLGGTVPPGVRQPAVLTVYDVQPLTHPERFSPLKRTWLARVLPQSVRRSRAVFTLSRYVGRQLRTHLGTPDERVVVVPPGPLPAGASARVPAGGAGARPGVAAGVRPGVGGLAAATATTRATGTGTPASAASTPAATAAAAAVAGGNGSPDEAELIRRRYGLAGPVLLYPAITYGHKNHQILVRALPRLLERHPTATLVCTGRPGPVDGEVASLAGAMGVGHAVRRLGRIPRPDLTELYRIATALVFPSTHEGFGLPLLEAMDHGCPILASDVSAIPEIVGDHGQLLDPDDPAAWSEAMATLLAAPARRRELADASAAGRCRFRWDTALDRTLATYHQAARSAAA
jgi:glycosyltransferase involved in cell wall biosynthesis